MKKGFVLSKALVYSFTIIWTVTSSINLFATETTGSTTQSKVLRMIDTKEEYGRSCESYSYLTPLQRLQFIRHNDFLLGDILRDSLSVGQIDEAYLVETNLTECSSESIKVSEYTYAEELGYLNEHIVTIDIFKYAYGAGAAHGNGTCPILSMKETTVCV
jgi:hypothetical protein